MRVALIIMPTWSVLTPPLGLATIQGVLVEAGYEVKVFDCNVALLHQSAALGLDENDWSRGASSPWANFSSFRREILPKIAGWLDEEMRKVAAWAPDVAGFSVFNTSFPCTDEAAGLLRRQNKKIKIIYGGPEITRQNLEQTAEFCSGAFDVAVMSEGESSVLKVLAQLAKGETVQGILGTACRLPDGEIAFEKPAPAVRLAEVPFPVFDGFELDRYEDDTLPVVMSRGCVARCAFCKEGRDWGAFRSSNAERVYREFTNHFEKYGVNNFLMADSLINGNFTVLSELVDLLLQHEQRFRILGIARIDPKFTLDFLTKLAQAGFYRINFGLETGSQKVMDLMQKRTTVLDANRVLKDCYRAGILVGVNIVVGFPGETESDFAAPLEFLAVNANFITSVLVNNTLITGGTALALQPEKFGIRPPVAGQNYFEEWVSDDEEGANTLELREARVREVIATLQRFPHIQIMHYSKFKTSGSVASAAQADSTVELPVVAAEEVTLPAKSAAFSPDFIRWSFGGRAYSSPVAGKPADFSFSFSFSPTVNRAERTFRQEVRAACLRLDQKRNGKTIALCVSGGIDSELIALTLLELGIPFEMFFLNIWNLNQKPFLEWTEYFREKSGKEIHEFELTRAEFFGSYALNTYMEFGCERPTYLALSYLFEQIPRDFFIVVGDGDLYRNWEVPVTPEASPASASSRKLLPFSSASVFFYNWAAKRDRAGEYTFFSSTPGLLASVVQHPNFEINGGRADPREVIYSEFPEILRRPKTNNWDTAQAVQENKLIRRWISAQARIRGWNLGETDPECGVDLEQIFFSERMHSDARVQ